MRLFSWFLQCKKKLPNKCIQETLKEKRVFRLTSPGAKAHFRREYFDRISTYFKIEIGQMHKCTCMAKVRHLMNKAGWKIKGWVLIQIMSPQTVSIISFMKCFTAPIMEKINKIILQSSYLLKWISYGFMGIHYHCW